MVYAERVAYIKVYICSNKPVGSQFVLKILISFLTIW